MREGLARLIRRPRALWPCRHVLRRLSACPNRRDFRLSCPVRESTRDSPRESIPDISIISSLTTVRRNAASDTAVKTLASLCARVDER